MVVNVFWIIKLLHVLEISHLVIIADFSFFVFFLLSRSQFELPMLVLVLQLKDSSQKTQQMSAFIPKTGSRYTTQSYYISAQYLFSVNEEIIESNSDVYDPVFLELKNNIEFFIHARKYFQLIYQEVLKLKDQNSCYFLQSLKIYCLKENYFL